MKKASGAFYSIINPKSFLFTLIIIFILVFGAASIVAYKHYESELLYAIAENKSTANLLSSLVYEHQKAATSILESYAQRPLFIDAIQKRDFHHVLYHLKSLNEHHTEMDALFISDQYGTVWANYPVSKESYGKNLAYRDWYKGVSKKWRPYISTVFRLIVLEKGLAVAVSVPVFDRKGKVIGILGSTQRTFFLATFIRANTLNPRKNITLLDQEGNIIYVNTVDYEKEITKYLHFSPIQEAIRNGKNILEIPDPVRRRKEDVLAFSPIRDMGWTVIVSEEKGAILRSETTYFIEIFAMAFLLFVCMTIAPLLLRRDYQYRETKELLTQEKKLRENQERYRNLVESISDVVYAIDSSGVLTYISPVVKNTLGYEPDELIGRQFLEFVHKEDHDLLMRRFSELREGIVEHSDYRVIGKQGDIKWVRTLTNPIIEEGGFAGARGVLIDITERKRMEEEAWRHNEELAALNAIAIMVNSSLDLQQILDQTLDKVLEITKMEVGSLYLIDPQTEELVLSTYRGVSKEFGDQVRTFKLGESIVGLAAQSGKPIVADDLTRDPRVTTPWVSGEGIRSLAAIPMKSKNKVQGMINMASYTCHSFTNEEIDFYTAIANQIGVAIENARLYEAVQRELTERKQAEEALRETQELLTSILDNAPMLIYVTLPDNRYRLVNRGWEEFVRLTREEAVGRLIEQVFSPKTACQFMEANQQVIDMGIPVVAEEFVDRSDGPYYFHTVKFPLRDTTGKVTSVGGISFDITERKRAEEEKRRLEERSRKVVEDIFRFIPEGVLVFSRKMELLRQNQAFRELVSGYAKRLGFAEDELENLIIDKIKAGMGDKKIKEIRISRKHETRK